MNTYFKDVNDEELKKIAGDIAKTFTTKGINDGNIVDINVATQCYVEFFNQAMTSLISSRRNEQLNEDYKNQNLNFR